MNTNTLLVIIEYIIHHKVMRKTIFDLTENITFFIEKKREVIDDDWVFYFVLADTVKDLPRNLKECTELKSYNFMRSFNSYSTR